MDSGAYPFLRCKYHHQIICSRLNLNIEHTYPYTYRIWNYSRAEPDLINCSIETCNEPYFFSGKILRQRDFWSIIAKQNYITNKRISCGNKDKCRIQIFDSAENLTV